MSKKSTREFYKNLSKRVGTIAECVKKREFRDGLKSTNTVVPGRYLTIQKRIRLATKIPLGESLCKKILAIARDHNRRFQEWSLGVVEDERNNDGFKIFTRGSNSDWSKRSTFQRGIIAVASGTIVSAKKLSVSYPISEKSNKAVEIIAPRGYYWGKDINGIKLVGKVGEYHPTASECLRGAASVVSLLKAAKASRIAAKKSAKLIIPSDLYVCVRDAIRGGNCIAGVTNWINRNKINKGHMKASRLIKLANKMPELGRVMGTVRAALERHNEEIVKGYCELRYHKT